MLPDIEKNQIIGYSSKEITSSKFILYEDARNSE